MMIKKLLVLLFLVFVSCSSTKSNINSNKHLFTINFMGQRFVDKQVTLRINDINVLEKQLFGEIPYPQTRGIHEISVGYRKGVVDLMKRYKVLSSKSLSINNLNDISVTLEVDDKTENFNINTREGKHYYIKYDSENDIEMIQLEW